MRKSTGTKDRAVAAAKLQEWKAAEAHRRAVNDGEPPAQTMQITYERLEEALLWDYAHNDRSSRPNLKHPRRAFSGKTGEYIVANWRQYETARRAAGVADATVKHELHNIDRMFSAAREQELTTLDPGITLKPPDNARKEFVTEAERARLDLELPEHLRPVLHAGYLTGWRVHSELLPLRWDNVELDAGIMRLRTSKNKEGRVFPFAAAKELADLIQRQHETRPPGCIYVFPSPTGKKISAKPFYAAWRKACRRADVLGEDGEHKIPHDLRRSAARNLARAGVPRSVAKKLIGHKTDIMYERYDITDERDLSTAVTQLSQYSRSRSS
jgi:integrase